MIKKMNRAKRLLAAGLIAAVLGTGLAATQMPTVSAKAKARIFDFQSHRGGRDARPENTLYAYAYAMEIGATTIECDMQLTKDGQLVMSHNPILNPDITKDASGNYIPKNSQYDLREMTVEEIQKFDVGSINPASGGYYEVHGKTLIEVPGAKIPTLEQLFQLINEYGDKEILVNVESKSFPDPAGGQAYKNNADPVKFCRAFNDLVKKYGMEDRVTLQSFDWRTLREMKTINPNITLVALYSQQPSWGRGSESLRAWEKEPSPWLGGLDIKDYQGDPVKAAKAIGADVVSPYFMEISKDSVAEAHALGMQVVPWTVNEASDMNMLIDMGVDGIITDRPWILKEIMQARGMRLKTPTVNASSKYHTGTAHRDVKTEKAKGGADAAS